MLSPLVFCPFYVVAIFAIVTRQKPGHASADNKRHGTMYFEQAHVCICSTLMIALCVAPCLSLLSGREWIRLPIVIYSSILFVDLSAFFVEAIWGEVPSPNIWAFTAGYIYYQVFPIIAIARFWKDHPFTVDPLCERAKIAPKKAQ